MKTSTQLQHAKRVAVLLGMILIAGVFTGCATTPSTNEPQKLVADARTTLSNFLRDPDQTWIQQNLSRAKAVLIAPQIVKAGFIFGGSGGRGVVLARDAKTGKWSGPAFYNLATASVGFQAGIAVSEGVALVMTEKGFNSLLATSFKLGGDASVAAGPVGRSEIEAWVPFVAAARLAERVPVEEAALLEMAGRL